MIETTTVHVVDHDIQRRQSVARVLFAMGLHAEPYEFLEEFVSHAPLTGIALLEASNRRLDHALDLMDDAHVWLPVVGYSETPTASAIVQAIHFGAAGYLAWPFDTTDVLEVLTMIGRVDRAGTIAFANGEDQRPADQPEARALVAKLTNRERQVLDQMLAGLCSREIGEILRISARTVEIHRQNLMRKLHVRNVVEAVKIAIEARQPITSLSRAAMRRGFGDSAQALGSKAA